VIKNVLSHVAAVVDAAQYIGTTMKTVLTKTASNVLRISTANRTQVK
jgi:hypothetical protein